MSNYDEHMWQEVLETYRCLISSRKNMPGMRLEDVFSDYGCLVSEYTWLQNKSNREGVEEKKKLMVDD